MLEIDVAQNIAYPLNEAAEMGGGSNVSDRAGWRVSVAFEIICEVMQVRLHCAVREDLSEIRSTSGCVVVQDLTASG